MRGGNKDDQRRDEKGGGEGGREQRLRKTRAGVKEEGEQGFRVERKVRQDCEVGGAGEEVGEEKVKRGIKGRCQATKKEKGVKRRRKEKKEVMPGN